MKNVLIILFLCSSISVTSQVGVGTSTPKSDVHISNTNVDGGTLQIDGGLRLGGDNATPGSKGTAGQVLTSGGTSGKATWETPGKIDGYTTSCNVVNDIATINVAVPNGSNRNTVNVTSAQMLTALNSLPNGGIILIRTLTATNYTAATTYLTVSLPSATSVLDKKFVIAFDGPIGSNNTMTDGDNLEIVVKASETNSLYYEFDYGSTAPKLFINEFPALDILDISRLENNAGSTQDILIFNSLAIEAIAAKTWSFLEEECFIRNPN